MFSVHDTYFVYYRILYKEFETAYKTIFHDLVTETKIVKNIVHNPYKETPPCCLSSDSFSHVKSILNKGLEMLYHGNIPLQ